MRSDRRKLLTLLTAGLLVGLVPGAGRGADPTPAQMRDALRKMRKETLDRLYRERPKLKAKLRGAAGYGVFSLEGFQLLFLGSSGGRGLVRDNLTGRDTYLRVASVGAGLGVGYRDQRLVLVFKSRDVLKRFVAEGWSFGSEGAAAAKAGNEGVADSGIQLADGIEAFPLVETGLIFKVTLQGYKYWPDQELMDKR
jgi:lipid-binding SYLF domain-containing protein